MKVQDLNYSVKTEYRDRKERERDDLMETKHLQLSGSTLTKEVSAESDKVYLCFSITPFHRCSQHTDSIPTLLIYSMSPTSEGSHSALNVHNAFGNCCFPLALKSHLFTRLSSSVLLFIFKGLNQDIYPQVNFNRLEALCLLLKCPENLLS